MASGRTIGGRQKKEINLEPIGHIRFIYSIKMPEIESVGKAVVIIINAP